MTGAFILRHWLELNPISTSDIITRLPRAPFNQSARRALKRPLVSGVTARWHCWSSPIDFHRWLKRMEEPPGDLKKRRKKSGEINSDVSYFTAFKPFSTSCHCVLNTKQKRKLSGSLSRVNHLWLAVNRNSAAFKQKKRSCSTWASFTPSPPVIE